MDKQLRIFQLITLICFTAMTAPTPILAPMILQHGANTAFFFNLPSKAIISILIGVYPLGVFIGAAIIGHLADKYNLKIILLSTLALASILQCLSGYFTYNKAFSLLILSRFLTGLLEGNIVIVRTAISRCYQTLEKRKKAFSTINATITVGWILGPAIGAFSSTLSHSANVSNSLPFFSSAIFTSLVWAVSFIYFKPSYKTNTNISSKSIPSYLAHYKNSFIKLVCVIFLITMGIDSFYQFIPIYLAGKLQFRAPEIALASIIVASTNALSNVYLTPLLHKYIRTDHTILIFSILLSLCLLLLAAIDNTLIIYILLPFVGVFIALTVTNIGTLISLTKSVATQGKLMGLLVSLRTLGAALVSFALIPALLAHYGMPFWIGSLFILIGWMLFFSAYLKNNDALQQSSSSTTL